MRIARVLCILALVYVHTPPYARGAPAELISADGFYWIWRELAGRTSVALLSVFSGFLVVRLGQSESWSAKIRKKVRTLIVPLLLWNLIALAKNFAVSRGQELPALFDLPRLLLAVDGNPALTPMYFLRDVFVCNLLIIPLMFGARRAALATGLLLFANAVFDVERGLFLNDAIPLFYFLGLLAGIGVMSADRFPMKAVRGRGQGAIAASVAIALMLLGTAGSYSLAGVGSAGEYGQNLSDVVSRLGGALLFWTVADRVRTSRAASEVVGFEPVIFFVFCSHPISLGAAWMAAQVAHVSYATPSYFLFFVVTPFISLIAGVVGLAVLRRVAPWLLTLLVGGRFPSDEQMRRIWAVLMPWRFMREGSASAAAAQPER